MPNHQSGCLHHLALVILYFLPSLHTNLLVCGFMRNRVPDLRSSRSHLLFCCVLPLPDLFLVLNVHFSLPAQRCCLLDFLFCLFRVPDRFLHLLVFYLPPTLHNNLLLCGFVRSWVPDSRFGRVHHLVILILCLPLNLHTNLLVCRFVRSRVPDLHSSRLHHLFFLLRSFLWFRPLLILYLPPSLHNNLLLYWFV